ncbi:MAG: arginase [Bryobacterales bacterium]
MTGKRVSILGVPLDLGQRRRGVDMGPSAIRAAELGARLRALGAVVEDDGDMDVDLPETQGVEDERARYAAAIAKTCRETADVVSRRMADGWTPLTLGGDHSLALGTLAGASRAMRQRGERLGLIWLDAHADMNTPETSPSGNVHGMPLAYALGLGEGPLAEAAEPRPLLEARNAVLVGVRDLDAGERKAVERLGLRVITMRRIDEGGIRAAVQEAMRIASDGTGGFHVSLDLDFVDPREAPGVGTPVRGGATYREAHLAMEMIADSGGLRSMDLVEVNPILDTANQTAELAAELALSAMGKRIL